jgi:hypothetical protein
MHNLSNASYLGQYLGIWSTAIYIVRNNSICLQKIAICSASTYLLLIYVVSSVYLRQKQQIRVAPKKERLAIYLGKRPGQSYRTATDSNPDICLFCARREKTRDEMPFFFLTKVSMLGVRMHTYGCSETVDTFALSSDCLPKQHD